ncbi:type II secretion system protein N [Xylophilus sp.]|uniref:type II secretion system protein N n=1 Tax=Xylophilus sp. TaxID=2653893 RepID=UPI0013B79D7F|nr:type II secretion system protein N [Xylophilus sp.]KAF1049819.1 MAG: hypothetical protein GAK38_00482 [Xylophilus sp.]
MARRPLRPALRRNTPSAPATPWRWAAAGTLAGLLPALLLFAPARWLAGAVERASDGHVLLAHARGTVWNGTAQLVLTGGAGSRDRAALPGQLAWQLRPAWLGARLAVQADCCTAAVPLEARVRIAGGGLRTQLADGETHWPADVLAGLGTPWNTMQPEGEFVLSTRGLTLHWAAGRASVAGQARLDALRMSSRVSTLRPLGSYRMALQGGSATTLQLETLPGSSLLLSGSGQWVGERLRFHGEAQAAPGRETVLSNLLNIIGRRNGARSIISVG